MDFEMNEHSIGSYRSFERALRKTQYWRLADTAFMCWFVLIVLTVPFVFGVYFGAHL